jgi:hypothetical protein
VGGCCEYSSGPLGSLKVQEFLNSRPPNKESAIWCYCVIYCSINAVGVVPE